MVDEPSSRRPGNVRIRALAPFLNRNPAGGIPVTSRRVLLAAAAVYAGIALLIFERGLRRYASGNRMVELR